MESEKLQNRIKELELEVSHLKASNIISQKAQLNDQSFHNLVEQSLCPILILKGDNLILDVANEPSFKILNVGKEALGKPLLDILPEMKDQPFMGLLLDVLHNHTAHYGKEQPAHFTRENGDIETVYFNFVYQPYAEIDGTVTGVLVFATDVTEQVIAYKKLEESKHSFSEMINSSPNLIAVLKGEDLVIEIANDTIIEVWGKGSDVKGKKYFDVLPELVAQGIPQMINEVYTSGKPFFANELPTTFIRNGKSELNYYSFVFQPQRSVVGIIEGIAIIGLDVTFQAKQNLKIKESEEQLRKTTEHFEIATSAAEVGTWTLSLATQTLEWSVLHKKMWGYDEKRTDLVYEDWHKVILETDKEVAFAALAQALATKTQYETSYRIKLDGREDVRWMRSSGKYFYNDAGKAIALTGVSIDITKQKNTENAIKESEERFRLLADNVPLNIFIIEPTEEANISYFNKYWLDYTGQTIEEALGKTWEGIVHPDDVQPLMDIFIPAYEARLPFHFPSVRLKRYDGEYRWFAGQSNPRYLPNGDFMGFIGVCFDTHESKLAQDALKASETFNRSVLESSPDCVKIIDISGRIQYMNKKGMFLMEIDHFTTIKNKPWSDLWGDENKQLITEAFDKAIAGETVQFQAMCATAKGTLKSWDIIVSPVHASGSQTVTNLVSVSRDISEQRTAQALSEYNRVLLEAHHQASFDGILLVDAKGKILSYNYKFIEIWDMPQQILDDKDDNAALDFAIKQLVDPSQFMEKVQYLYDHPTEISIDELQFKNGKIVERHGYPAIADDGSYCAWSWTFRDVTILKKIELALQTSEKHFRLMANLMPAKISNATPAGTVTYFNKHWLDYTGMNFEDLNEFGYHSIIHPDELEEFQNRFLKAAATGNVLEMEMRFKSKNGDYKWHLHLASPIKDENGKITMWVGSTTEIQHQKEQREELEKAVAEGTYELKQANVLLEDKNRALQNMNKELEAFNYISSHDLQEPLRKIQIIVSRILDSENQNLSETGKNHFIVLQKAADRMRTLIQDLLSFSRLNTNDVLFEKTNLNAIIEEVKKEFEDVVTEKNATIEIIDNCEIHIIRFQFRQLMYNLIGNALKFSNPKIAPRITIKTEILQPNSLSLPLLLVGKEYCHISISDNGIGFEKEFKTKIFEVFQRLHSQEQYSGTGIGLAIVKKIVDNHNGIITSTSKLNEGATFDVYIPTNHKK